LLLNSGNFAWGSEHITAKTRVLGVVFNASNNELVRTNTLVKGAIIQVDATPFRMAYEKHYGKPVTTKRRAAGAGALDQEAEVKKSGHVEKKLAGRQKDATLDALVEQQFGSGRLYAAISESTL
jgi:small subunit ribosomal protein S8e